jgi:phage-related minor tail protein
MVGSVVSILASVPWDKVIEHGPSLIKRATEATASIGTFLADLRAEKKSGPKKESAAERLARLTDELEALAAHQQQLAQVLKETSEQQQAIIRKVTLNRQLCLGAIALGGLNLVLIGLVALLR